MKKLLIILLSALSLTAVAQQKKVAVYVTGQQTGINKVLGDQLGRVRQGTELPTYRSR